MFRNSFGQCNTTIVRCRLMGALVSGCMMRVHIVHGCAQIMQKTIPSGMTAMSPWILRYEQYGMSSARYTRHQIFLAKYWNSVRNSIGIASGPADGVHMYTRFVVFRCKPNLDILDFLDFGRRCQVFDLFDNISGCSESPCL